jgi:hypothetical protein
MRNQRVLTRILSGVAGSVLILSVAACGGDGSESAEESPGSDTASSAAPDDSADTATDDETAETDTETEAEGGYDEDELLDAMKAAVAEAESAHVTMELNGDGQQAMTGEGDVSYAGDSTAMQMTMSIPQMGTGEMELRMLDGVMYMAMPPMTPEGKFIKIDTNDPNSPFGDLGGVTTGDPLATFKSFDAGLQDVEYVGAEDVEGEQMDHYVLTVDAKRAAKAQKQSWQKGMPETISYDMWLDDSDLMRRIEFDLGAMMGAQGGGSGGMVMTMDDWGKPVTVKAPPAKDLVEMPGGAPQG